MAQHVRQGDMVIVVCGDGSKRVLPDGRKVRDMTPRKIMRVLPSDGKVIVEGVNLCKKHVRPSPNQQQGGVIEKEMPIAISNVMPVADAKPTRVRFRTADGGKTRVAARTGEQLGRELRKPR